VLPLLRWQTFPVAVHYHAQSGYFFWQQIDYYRHTLCPKVLASLLE
jgi:hypothetical protein